MRTTEGFRALGPEIAAACRDSPEIDRVLTEVTETATAMIGQTPLQISAVTDGAGLRRALLCLTLDAEDETPAPAGSDDWVTRLSDCLKESSALAWLKDATGRHLYVNRRYLETLQVTEDTVLGRTDEELPPGETVDGPRRSRAEDGIEEPQELEYTVPAFAHRPTFAAVRFLVRDPDGHPLGTCGLAGPLDQAQLVRQEADRVARAATGPGLATQHELLREWGLAPAERTPPLPDGPWGVAPETLGALEEPSGAAAEERPPGHAPGPEESSDLAGRWDECVQRLQGEAQSWQEEISRSRSMMRAAQERLTQATAERAAAERELDQLRGARDGLERLLSAERMRSEELVRTIEQLRVQISDVGRTIEHALPGEAADSDAGDDVPQDLAAGLPGWSG